MAACNIEQNVCEPLRGASVVIADIFFEHGFQPQGRRLLQPLPARRARQHIGIFLTRGGHRKHIAIIWEIDVIGVFSRRLRKDRHDEITVQRRGLERNSGVQPDAGGRLADEIVRLVADDAAILDRRQRHAEFALDRVFDFLDPPPLHILRFDEEQHIWIFPCRIGKHGMGVVEELNETIVLVAREIMSTELAFGIERPREMAE